MPTFTHFEQGREAQLKPPILRLYRQPVIASNDGWSWGAEETLSDWRAETVHWASNGGVSRMKVKRIMGQGSGIGRTRPEDLDVSPGDKFRLVEIQGDMPIEWFRGVAGLENSTWHGDFEAYSQVVYGPEQLLATKYLPGLWTKIETADDSELAGSIAAAQTVRSGAWQSHLPAVFNPGRLPNASASTWKLCTGGHYASSSSNPCRVFEAPGRIVRSATSSILETQYWTAYTALRSLIEWLDDYETINYDETDWDAIEALLSPVLLSEVRVSGLNLLEAMTAVLVPYGFGFCIEPHTGPDAFGKPRHRLRVYSLTNPAVLYSPAMANIAGGNPSITSAEGQQSIVQRLHFARDDHNVATDIVVVGDQKRIQIGLQFGGSSVGVWQLFPWWNSDSHDPDDWDNSNVFSPDDMPSGKTFDAFCQKYDVGGNDHADNQHAFRSFGWGEDGSGYIFRLAEGEAVLPELDEFHSDILADDDGNIMRRPRPVNELFTFDGSSARVKRLPAQVWMGIQTSGGTVAADSWMQVPAKIWRDRAGFTLAKPKLSDWYPWKKKDDRWWDEPEGGNNYQDLHYMTLLHNAFRAATPGLVFVLYGSIETDDTRLGIGSPSIRANWPFTTTRVICEPQVWTWRERTDAGQWSDLRADTESDSADIDNYADRLAEAAACAMGHGSITLKQALVRVVYPGLGIPDVDGRPIDFALNANGSKVPVVVGVAWDFREGANKTELVLDSPLVKVLR